MSAVPTIAVNIEQVLTHYGRSSHAQIQAALAPCGFPPQRIRDSLHSLCEHRRVRRYGKRTQYRYGMHPDAPPRSARDLAVLSPLVLLAPVEPVANDHYAIAQAGPAIAGAQRLDRNPVWRI